MRLLYNNLRVDFVQDILAISAHLEEFGYAKDEARGAKDWTATLLINSLPTLPPELQLPMM